MGGPSFTEGRNSYNLRWGRRYHVFYSRSYQHDIVILQSISRDRFWKLSSIPTYNLNQNIVFRKLFLTKEALCDWLCSTSSVIFSFQNNSFKKPDFKSFLQNPCMITHYNDNDRQAATGGGFPTQTFDFKTPEFGKDFYAFRDSRMNSQIKKYPGTKTM